MAYDHIQKTCYNAFINNSNLKEADESTTIKEFDMDSLDEMRVLLEIEEDLNIEQLPDETIADCTTLGELIAKVRILTGPVK